MIKFLTINQGTLAVLNSVLCFKSTEQSVHVDTISERNTITLKCITRMKECIEKISSTYPGMRNSKNNVLITDF